MHDGTPIIVKKKKGHGGHAHHGGSWKVAYADFVTAMMAFFMVMWIMGLSEETRAQIQGYFNDPMGFMRNMPRSRNVINLQGAPPKPSPASSTFEDGKRQDEKRLKELSALISELTQKIPPLLNTQSAQLDELGRQLQKVSQGGEVEQLNRGLLDMSRALDLLGQKITAKVDEQDRILNKTAKRLDALEAKLGSKGKRSARLESEDFPFEERPLCADHEETCWKETRRIHFVVPMSK